MEPVMKLARGNYKDGWKPLYENTKKRIYTLCHYLIQDDYRKDEVFVEVYKELFSKLDQMTLETEKDFENFLCLETIKKCKIEEFSKDPHVFKNYSTKDVVYKEENKASSKEYETSKDEMMRCLNELDAPLSFVLKAYWISPCDISRALGVDEMKLDSLVQKALSQLKTEDISVCEYKSLIEQGMNQAVIPSSMEEKMQDYIRTNGKNQPGKKKWIGLFIVVAVAVIGIMAAFGNKEDATYLATIDVENYGTIELELYESVAPKTVQNFVELADSGFYDGLTFHRIMDGFMIQGGDPNHDGTGGSENTIKGEFSSNGVENTLSHERGVISMARSQDPDSASSQFFICQQDSTFLDGEYAAFGKVIEGMDVVDKIAQDANPTDDNGTIPYEEQPVIKSITVEKK